MFSFNALLKYTQNYKKLHEITRKTTQSTSYNAKQHQNSINSPRQIYLRRNELQVFGIFGTRWITRNV